MPSRLLKELLNEINEINEIKTYSNINDDEEKDIEFDQIESAYIPNTQDTAQEMFMDSQMCKLGVDRGLICNFEYQGVSDDSLMLNDYIDTMDFRANLKIGNLKNDLDEQNINITTNENNINIENIRNKDIHNKFQDIFG